jgi:type IV pilus assembly protein PilB
MAKGFMRQPLRGLPLHLVMSGILDETRAKEAFEAARESGVPFVLYLVNNNILSAWDIIKVAHIDFGVPILDLDAFNTDLIPLNLIDGKMVRRHQALPIYLNDEKQLYIAMSDPTNLPALYEFKFNTGFNTHPILVEEPKLNNLIDKIIGAQEASALSETPDEILSDIEMVDIQDSFDDDAGKATEDDAPIIKFINGLLLDAVNKHASDIHFEPYENTYRIRFRQDGILYKIASPPNYLKNRIASRIKVMARLDSTEHRLPQDGHFKWRFGKTHMIDFRVSTCPTVHGEKVVVRILDTGNLLLSIDDLGLDSAACDLVLKAINKTQGMVLVTGPTGSGKTVTLYTLLSMLNTEDKNISTVEDPVEINLKGINQVNINVKAGLDFPIILRSFLRQDPDIIMVGEMRDLDTADIGIKAAQTGHLVLATLHTNSAPETLSRLLNMGVPSYNVATSASLIIAQRLARKLCPVCKQEIQLDRETLLKAGFLETEIQDIKVYAPVGCENCMGGYKDRVGIFEVLPVTNAVSKIILSGGTVMDITNKALEEGLITLRRSALEKVKQGITSLEEIDRVVSIEQ